MAALLLLTLPLAAAAHPAPRTYPVANVLDADTLTLSTPHEPLTIRLAAIDAPESDQPGGAAATTFLRHALEAGRVSLTLYGQDRYGRLIAAAATPDGRDLGHLLTAAGHAWWYRAYGRFLRQYAPLELEARRAERGLWARPDPIPPWLWRRGQTAPQTDKNRRPRIPHKRRSPVLPILTTTPFLPPSRYHLRRPPRS